MELPSLSPVCLNISGSVINTLANTDVITLHTLDSKLHNVQQGQHNEKKSVNKVILFRFELPACYHLNLGIF